MKVLQGLPGPDNKNLGCVESGVQLEGWRGRFAGDASPKADNKLSCLGETRKNATRRAARLLRTSAGPRFWLKTRPPSAPPDHSSPTCASPYPPSQKSPNMSSLVDAVIGSDNFGLDTATPASTASQAGRRPQNRSPSRPRGPPSESAGANSDIEGFPDDEVVGARGTVRRSAGPRQDIPRVVDVTGETLSQRFEEFLET